jgi:hypothetical protein
MAISTKEIMEKDLKKCLTEKEAILFHSLFNSNGKTQLELIKILTKDYEKKHKHKIKQSQYDYVSKKMLKWEKLDWVIKNWKKKIDKFHNGWIWAFSPTFKKEIEEDSKAYKDFMKSEMKREMKRRIIKREQ